MDVKLKCLTIAKYFKDAFALEWALCLVTISLWEKGHPLL